MILKTIGEVLLLNKCIQHGIFFGKIVLDLDFPGGIERLKKNSLFLTFLNLYKNMLVEHNPKKLICSNY